MLCLDNEDDGNEADDTSDLSDEDGLSRAVIDSSMSSIQISRVLTPGICHRLIFRHFCSFVVVEIFTCGFTVMEKFGQCFYF